MIEIIKGYLFPEIDREAEKIVDEESLKNIYRLSLILAFFELVALATFLATTKVFDRQAGVTICNVLFCFAVCFAGRLKSDRLLRSVSDIHSAIVTFKVVYCLVLWAWAIWTSYRHYCRGEQLLTFYAVELMIVCFITLSPGISMALNATAYAGLYIVLYCVDGAEMLNILNYLALVFVSMVGMIVRFHSQASAAKMTIRQRHNNDLLEHANRHDGLTGLRNRKALEEDAAKLAGQQVTAVMIDLNYFKEVNDNYGHLAGDAVLRETARQLRKLFPSGNCYRYGGDEFLVLDTEGELYAGDHYSFSVPAVPDEPILISIGRAEGIPDSGHALFEVIAAADVKLYEVKEKTHSPDFGGHGKRQGRSKRESRKNSTA